MMIIRQSAKEVKFMQTKVNAHTLYFDDEFLKEHNGFHMEHSATVHEMTPVVSGQIVLAYTAHGKGIFCEKDAKHEISDGDIILINKGSQYCFKSTKPGVPLSFYICVFNLDNLPYSWKSITSAFKEARLFFNLAYTSLIVHDTEHNDVRNMMIRLLDEYTYAQPNYEMSFRCELVVALTTIFRLYSSARINKAPQNDNQVLGNAYNYVNRNIYMKCSLTEIADYLHMSPQYICRVFKKNVGMTFIEYCNYRRVEKIKDSLEHTDRPLYIVYNDFDFTPRYLNKIFKEHTGYSVKEYKEKFNYKVDNPLYPK